MIYHGRSIDPINFWSRYVEFPTDTRSDDTFTSKVQCPNPEHDTLKRHFQVNIRQPYVHCFAHCGISGSWEHAICVIEGLYEKHKVDIEICKTAWEKKPAKRSASERDQLRRVHKARHDAERIILKAASGKLSKISSRASVSKKPRPDAVAASTVIPSLEYESYLPPVALEYLERRGISGLSVAKWKIGWDAEDKRIVIPAHDLTGTTRLLIKRSLKPDEYLKYLYWPEKEVGGWGKTDILFGACFINPGMVRSSGLVLVEGSIGTILNHQHGLTNTVAILGTGISRKQVQIITRLRPSRIYFMFDRDSAGIKNIEIAMGSLRKYPCYVVRFPSGKYDWDLATREEKARQISRAVPAMQFIRKNGLNVSSYRKDRVGT